MTEIFSQEWLEERGKLMQREDSRLTKLLQKLDQEDEYCYAYLSNSVLKLYNDKSVLYHVGLAHSDKRMRLNLNSLNGNPNEEFLDDFIGEELLVPQVSWKSLMSTFPDAHGIIDNVYTKKAAVLFSGKFCTVLPDSDLIVYGRKGTWYRKEKRYPETRGDYFKLACGDLVRVQFDKKQLSFSAFRGVEPVIADRKNSEWELQIPGVDYIKLYSDGSDLCVYREKMVDYKKLYRECYNG